MTTFRLAGLPALILVLAGGLAEPAACPTPPGASAVERASAADPAPAPQSAPATVFPPAPVSLIRKAQRADRELVPLRPARRGEWADSARFVPGRAAFAVEAGDVWIPYRVMGVAALPGETVELAVDGAASSGPFLFRDRDGTARRSALGVWRWTAPDAPGVYPIRVVAPNLSDSVHLNMLVLHPRKRKENAVLGGYRIGHYPRPGPGTEPGAIPPSGFVEVGPEEKSVLVSPHFSLGQFVSHQPGSPRYIAYSELLILKLEAILEEVNEEGYPAPTLHVMSGFRTPHYNRAIGNTTTYSRHLWGDAADIFLDTSGDGRMDDLTGDGRGGIEDARILYRIAERVERSGERHIEAGGLSLYPPNDVRGPFVHVDARGRTARW